MHGDRTNRVVDFEAALDPEMQLVHEHDANHGDEHGLDRVVEVVAGRGCNDAGKPAGIGPEGIALGDHIARQETAGERHQEVHRDRR